MLYMGLSSDVIIIVLLSFLDGYTYIPALIFKNLLKETPGTV